MPNKGSLSTSELQNHPEPLKSMRQKRDALIVHLIEGIGRMEIERKQIVSGILSPAAPD